MFLLNEEKKKFLLTKATKNTGNSIKTLVMSEGFKSKDSDQC